MEDHSEDSMKQKPSFKFEFDKNDEVDYLFQKKFHDGNLLEFDSDEELK